MSDVSLTILANFSRWVNDFRGFRTSHFKLLTGGAGASSKARTSNCAMNADSGCRQSFVIWYGLESQPYN